MTDKDEVNRIISKEYLKDSNVSLYLFENKKTKREPLSIYSLNINEDIVRQIRKTAIDHLVHVSTLIAKEKLHNLPFYNPDNEQSIFKIDSNEVSMFLQLFEYISGKSPAKSYSRKDIKENRLKAWIIRCETRIDGKIEQILFFQRFQPSKMLGARSISMFQHDKEFRLVDKNLFNINLTMDFFFYKNTLIVTKMYSFENIFEYEQHYKNNAVELIKEFDEAKIEGLDYTVTFTEMGSVIEKINKSPRLARKLYSSRANGYFKKINYKKLKDLNTRHTLELDLDDSTNQWTIDEESDLQVTARILNDDYERSQLTDNEYIAIGKEKIKVRNSGPLST